MVSSGPTTTDAIAIERATLQHADALSELFVSADVPCFCQYYAFEGDHRAWQDRCSNSREDNRRALGRELEQERLIGWVGSAGGQVVGFLRIRLPGEMGKLYDGRLYRGLPCFSGDRTNVAAVSCFLIDPVHRRQGLATELLRHAIEGARQLGFACLEGFPRGATDVSDEEQWTGPLSLYRKLGFETVHEFSPYPVVRLVLT